VALRRGDCSVTSDISLGGKFFEHLGGGRIALSGEALESCEVAALGCGLDQLVDRVGVPTFGTRTQHGDLGVSHEWSPFLTACRAGVDNCTRASEAANRLLIVRELALELDGRLMRGQDCFPPAPSALEFGFFT
jgi:hypothetical protein